MKILLSLCLFSIGLSSLPSVRADEKTVVQTTNYPIYYFATRLATDAFEVEYLVEPEIDPAFWKPSDESLIALQEADLILTNGADYEKWMKTVTLPKTSLVDTSRSFRDSYIKTKGKAHTHGNGEVHSHGGTVFTTWMDFAQASAQASAIAAALEKENPDASDQIAEQLAALQSDLDALDKEMIELGADWGDKPIVASHPIYHYLARAYGLSIESLEWEPEMTMTEKDRKDLEKLLEGHPAEFMLWEGTPLSENATAVEELGMESFVFDPCANRPEEGDWLSVMKDNILNFRTLNRK